MLKFWKRKFAEFRNCGIQAGQLRARLFSRPFLLTGWVWERDYNTHSGAKRHREIPNQKVARRQKCFSSDGLVQICVTISRTKQQHFSPSSAPAHRLFPGLKSHEAIRTAQWRTMASFTTPIFFTCTHAHKSLSNEVIITQDYWIRNTVGVRGVWRKPGLVNDSILHRKPVSGDLLLCNRWQTSAQQE